MFRRVVPTVLALLLLAAPATAAAPPVEIRLHEELSTDRATYTLAEIATLASADGALVERLREVRIGRSPRVGQSSAVTRSEVAGRIERAFPGLHHRTRWEGPPRAIVRAVGRELPLARWSDLARDHLARRLAPVSPDPELWLVSDSGATVSLPAGRLEVVPRTGSAAGPSRRMCVWLDFFVEGERYATVPLWFGVSAPGDAVVATHDLAPGTVLSPADLAVARADLAAASGEPLPGLDAAAGARTRRGVAAGEILARNAIEPVPAVVRGEPVVVTARSGPVLVEATALALEDGREGESIRVRQPRNDARFHVVVTGPRRAVVEGDEL